MLYYQSKLTPLSLALNDPLILVCVYTDDVMKLELEQILPLLSKLHDAPLRIVQRAQRIHISEHMINVLLQADDEHT